MIVIDVENLSKRYQLGHQPPERYATLRDVLSGAVNGLGRCLAHPFRGSIGQPFATATSEDFYALRDVSFQVRQGDRLGIIGRNGAGKSTLLKILSRITEPTAGRVRIRGRVASLLEVGTGFHPELTGRENIFLNGAILGMSRAEIRLRFDEIVAFADVEKFLDTPVKRYSSGMYVRLAFAVAAHLEPEILIVDEVLAVGDAQFQKKCLMRMEEVGKEGRTILFVSHNMGAIRQLCSSGVMLSSGEVFSSGGVGHVLDEYVKTMATMKSHGGRVIASNESIGINLVKIVFFNQNGLRVAALQTGMAGSICLVMDVVKSHRNVQVSISVNTLSDIRVCIFHTMISSKSTINLYSSVQCLICSIPKVTFIPGLYQLHIKLILESGEVVFYAPYAMDMLVEAGDFFGTGRLPETDWAGLCLVEHSWIVENFSTEIQ